MEQPDSLVSTCEAVVSLPPSSQVCFDTLLMVGKFTYSQVLYWDKVSNLSGASVFAVINHTYHLLTHFNIGILTQTPTSSIPSVPRSSTLSSTDINTLAISPEGSTKRKACDPLEAPQKKKSRTVDDLFRIHPVLQLASELFFKKDLPWGFLVR
jgi:hypothetical protein